jgi:hypothetical protein
VSQLSAPRFISCVLGLHIVPSQVTTANSFADFNQWLHKITIPTTTTIMTMITTTISMTIPMMSKILISNSFHSFLLFSGFEIYIYRSVILDNGAGKHHQG